ncbi:NAD(P)-dependent alcohol dehydrogenase [Roseomonas sp. BN140053]|uniref:NAD(P)-dependent alcohol dehydrogenase n=1 Tax=Roseomonas sp. BN140053 TaxID=3391898 RepID=UPI0039E9B3CB
MQVTAAVVRAKYAPMSLERIELEEPRPDELLVRLVATGICRTDAAMRDGKRPVPQPVVLGHEGAGVVERVGTAVTGFRPGDHVVMSYNFCGHCPPCDDGHPAYCDHSITLNFGGQRPDGSVPFRCDTGERVHGDFFGQSSFATHALCHQQNAVKVPDEAPLELLGPLSCGIQTGAGAVINALRVGVGASLLVSGSGSVGLAAVMAARVVGATTIIASDTNPARRELALELGATHAIDPVAENTVEAARRITGRGLDFAFDTTGIPAVFRQCIEALGPCGTAGYCAIGGPEFSVPMPDMMNNGKRVMGIVQGDSVSARFIPALVALHAQGRFPFEKLLTFYPFERINEAMADMEAGRVVKPVLRFPAG